MSYGAAMDRETLEFYQNRAVEWAALLPHASQSPAGMPSSTGLPRGASILELGCGDGREAARMVERGFEVHPSDGTASDGSFG
jgi:2-polyprenyl-3-methyl-5-hydroxy-6-metoxy-1,4-benzoquinol methylase